MLDKETLDALESELPPVVSRMNIAALTGGLIHSRYLSNLDSRGLGPRPKLRCGRYVCYSRKSFIEWLAGRMGD